MNTTEKLSLRLQIAKDILGFSHLPKSINITLQIHSVAPFPLYIGSWDFGKIIEVGIKTL